MPGATTARLVFFDSAIDWKEFMIPQTVPNSPTKGETEPIEARKFIPFSRRSISRVMVKVIDRSTRPRSEARRSDRAAVARPLALARRHSRMPATNTRVIASRGSPPISSYRASADPPDQKASSNRSE